MTEATEGLVGPSSSQPPILVVPVIVAVEDIIHEEEDLGPLMVVEVTQQVDIHKLKGNPFSGTFTLSPSFNFIANTLSLSDLDWVELYKKLTITSSPNRVSLPISTALLEDPPPAFRS